MSDRIIIKDLHLRAIIGINDDERIHRQDVLINLTMFTDTRRAAESDDIVDAVNYRTVTKNVIDLVENSRFHLVETLADQIARLCLAEETVERVQVRVEKPTALRFAGSVGVEIERMRAQNSAATSAAAAATAGRHASADARAETDGNA